MNNDLEFDPNKQTINQNIHNDIDFEEADSVLDDPLSITNEDYGDYEGEQRYFTLGMSSQYRLLVVIWTIRDENIRIISSRLAEPHQRKTYANRR